MTKTQTTLQDLANEAILDQEKNGHCDICDNSDRRYWGLCENCYDEMHAFID